jgi:hypothetical protein
MNVLGGRRIVASGVWPVTAAKPVFLGVRSLREGSVLPPERRCAKELQSGG